MLTVDRERDLSPVPLQPPPPLHRHSKELSERLVKGQSSRTFPEQIGGRGGLFFFFFLIKKMK